MIGLGTLLNVVAVLAGASLGLLLGHRLPERVRHTCLQAVGLGTLLVGMQMALQVQNVLIVLASLMLGAIVGELLGIEARLAGLGRWLEQRFGGLEPGAAGSGGRQCAGSPPGQRSGDLEPGEADPRTGASAASGTRTQRFVRGFVTASLIFCVGPLTILGSIQDGLAGDHRLLAVKSLLDGFVSIILASTLGPGVAFSALVILVYQGGLTLAAAAIGTSIPDPARNPAVLELTAVGGVLVLGIGLRLLEIKDVPVGNLLPAVALAPLLTVWLGGPLARLLGSP